MNNNKILAVGFIYLIIFLLSNILPGCSENKSTRSLYIEYHLYGTWEEEYTIRYYKPSIFEWGEDVWVEKDFISLVKFKDDSYTLKIFQDQDNLLLERSGNFHFLGDTIFFDVTYNDSIVNTKTLGYKFISEDSLFLHSISYSVNDSIIAINLLGFVWEIPFTHDLSFIYGASKNYGVFIRQE